MVVKQIRVRGNVNVVIKVDATSMGTSKCVLERNHPYSDTLFYLEGDSLNKATVGSIRIEGASSSNRLILRNGKTDTGTINGTTPLIRTFKYLANLTVRNVTFADSSYGAIEISSNDLHNLVIENCTFSNTIKRTGSHGGAIYQTFMGREPGTTNTGSNWVEWNTIADIWNMQITNCTFDGNTALAPSGSTSERSGGAICFYGRVDEGVVKDSTFKNCKASSYGGAVAIFGVAESLTFSNCSFTGCTSRRGGAVYVWSRNVETVNNNLRFSWVGDLAFNDCKFSNCSATESGGGIYLNAHTNSFTVSGGSFTNCTSSETGSGFGGAIAIQSRSLGTEAFSKDYVKTASVSWLRNRFQTVPDAVNRCYEWETIDVVSDTVTDRKNISIVNNASITGVTFDSCKASGGGGFALHNQTSVKEVRVDDCVFLNNVGHTAGSAMYVAGGIIEKMYLSGTRFEGNSFNQTNAEAKLDEYGGTFRTVAATCLDIEVDNCDFIGNSTLRHGAGFYFNACTDRKGIDGNVVETKAAVKNSRFYNNVAPEKGGGMFVEGTVTVQGCDFSGNSADWGGGIAQQVVNSAATLMADGEATDLTLDSTTWIHDNTAIYGGGISVVANASRSIPHDSGYTIYVRFHLNGAAVYNNSAVDGGGIHYTTEHKNDTETGDQAEVDAMIKEIYIDAPDGKENTAAVYNNTATRNGGGVYMDSSENTGLYIRKGFIANNTAGNDGGGVYLTGKNAVCYITGGTVGGAANDGVVQLDEQVAVGALLPNVAGRNGGGIVITGGSMIEMSGGEVLYNEAASKGGGIYVDDITNTGTEDIHNAIEFSGGTIQGNRTTGETAAVYGAGVFVGKNGLAVFSGGLISGNIGASKSVGGGLYTDGANVTVSGTRIFENEAKYGGGIAAEYGSIITLTTLNQVNSEEEAGSIEGNVASSYGGGIFADNGAQIIASGGNVSGNQALNGAGIAVIRKASVVINGGSVTNNIAMGHGGGIYVEDNDYDTDNGSYITDRTTSEATVYTGDVSGNTAKGNGGGIYATGPEAMVLVADMDSTTSAPEITNNTATNGGGVCAVGGADLIVRNGMVINNFAIGTPNDVSTAYRLNTTLRGTGGGIYVADGLSGTERSTFTMEGDRVAIYGNLAAFAAEDVFANSVYTDLNVPLVSQMSLQAYGLPVVGWFEDYPINDVNYTAGTNFGLDTGNVRYRKSDVTERFEIKAENNALVANEPNAYVCMTLGVPAALPDVVVVDFGLPVEIDVLSNEMAITDGSDVKIGAWRNWDGSNLSDYTQTLADGFATSYQGVYGDAQVQNNQVLYTLKTTNMSSAEIFSYAVKYNNYYFYSDVKIIPATNIYYEDSFLKFTDSTAASGEYGRWSQDGETVTGNQSEDRPGQALDAIDADNVYGYDPVYGNCATYSMGSAYKVTVDMATGSMSAAPKASFTFTGTGFDVVSLTNHISGGIRVEVRDMNQGGKIVRNTIINTYYGYSYSEEDGWLVNPEAADTLYQIPVIKVSDLPYSTYEVDICAAYLSFMDVQKAGHYTVWVDAVRIYNPAMNDSEANEAYEKDLEMNSVYATIKSLLLSQDEVISSDGVTGVVYMDGRGDVSIKDYEAEGPNNEVYLTRGNGIAFKIRATTAEEPLAVHIGAKLARGEYAVLQVNGKSLSAITTATSLFYPVEGITWTQSGDGSWVSSPIVLVCTDTDAATAAILSLTDLKFTSTSAETMVSSSVGENPDEALNRTGQPTLVTLVDDETVDYGFTIMTEPELCEHSWDEGAVSTPATCTAEGIMSYTCVLCGEVMTDSIPATGHSFDEGVETTPATCTAEGVMTFTCVLCGEVKAESIAAAGHIYDDGVCVDCGEADPNFTPEPKPDPGSFTDLAEDAWYYEAVVYAVENGLMNGVAEDRFNPDGTLTRAMLVTMLYRLADEPEIDVSELCFEDVPADLWYTNAVAWAVAEGITNGATPTKFNPDAPVTREQMVTFLWRYAGKPEATEGYGENHPLDVGEISAFAADAMAWAYENGIINGMDGKLAPQKQATRAQIATIFMRFETVLEAEESMQ